MAKKPVKNPRHSKADPVTIAPGSKLMAPDHLLEQQRKDADEQKRKDLKSRLLKSGGYKE